MRRAQDIASLPLPTGNALLHIPTSHHTSGATSARGRIHYFCHGQSAPLVKLLTSVKPQAWHRFPESSERLTPPAFCRISQLLKQICPLKDSCALLHALNKLRMVTAFSSGFNIRTRGSIFLLVNTSLGIRTSSPPVQLCLSMASIHNPLASSSTASYHTQDTIANELMLLLNPFSTKKALGISQSVCKQTPNHTIRAPPPTKPLRILLKKCSYLAVSSRTSSAS